MSLYTIGMGLFPLGWTFGGTLSALIGNELTLIVSALGGNPSSAVGDAANTGVEEVVIGELVADCGCLNWDLKD